MFKSWAIPKGPSLDPTVKRLALAVEDHELSHANFEGALGKNSTRLVIVWDSGWFEEVLDMGVPAKATLEKGAVNFVLHGQRLKGRFSLVKVKRRKRDWLLIKREDDEARAGFDVTAYYQTSILSGMTIEDLEKSAKS